MLWNHPRFHLGVFGGSGTGKTTYALRFISNAKSRCVFLFDAEAEFQHKLKLRPALTGADIDAAVETGAVCFDPHTLFPGELERALDFFTQCVVEISKRMPGRKLFVVDELGRYVTGQAVPKPLKTLVQTGRRYGIDGVFIGQQPNELHNTIRSQLSEVVCFRLTDECALEFPKKFGFDTDAVRALPNHRWICRDDQGNECRG